MPSYNQLLSLGQALPLKLGKLLENPSSPEWKAENRKLKLERSRLEELLEFQSTREVPPTAPHLLHREERPFPGSFKPYEISGEKNGQILPPGMSLERFKFLTGLALCTPTVLKKGDVVRILRPVGNIDEDLIEPGYIGTVCEDNSWYRDVDLAKVDVTAYQPWKTAKSGVLGRSKDGTYYRAFWLSQLELLYRPNLEGFKKGDRVMALRPHSTDNFIDPGYMGTAECRVGPELMYVSWDKPWKNGTLGDYIIENHSLIKLS